MLSTRFEDYTDLNRNLPFMFSDRINRTKDTSGSEANWHENLEIQICTDGGGFVILDGVKRNIKKNDVVVANSQVIHYTGTDTKLYYTCLIIDSDFCKSADIDSTSLTFEALFSDKDFLSLYNDFREAFLNTGDVCRVAKLKRHLLDILIYLREHHTVNRSAAIAPKASFQTVQEAIKFIRDHYREKIYIDDVASLLMTNKYSLAHSFKKVTGQTLVSYLNSYRCKKAAELIRDGKNVNEAAELCGFNNMSFFTKTFKKYLGYLPSKSKGE